jgi:alpha-L-arabinofuranosidase
MKLWREHYAPLRIAIEGDTKELNAVATKSQIGRKVYFKAVNPTDREMDISLLIDKSFRVRTASMKKVAPGSLSAMNSLTNPAAVKPEHGQVTRSNQTVNFKLPSYSAAVVTVER